MIRALWGILLLAVPFACAPAQSPSILPSANPEEIGLTSQGLAQLDSFFLGYINEGKIPGVVIAVARKGRLGHLQSLGHRDLQSGAPMAPDAIFRIMSMTKPIVSVAAMILWEEGLLSLDEPASVYLPELVNMEVLPSGVDDPEGSALEPTIHPITVRHLLTHTAGLGLGAWGFPADSLYGAVAVDPRLTLKEKTTRFGSFPLLYQPGAEWKYSIGTDILGDLIERVSGMGLEEFLRSRIFDPLGMNDTGFYVVPDKADRVVSLYRATQEESLEVVTQTPAPNELEPPRAPSGAGGLYSTPLDYLRFAQMLLNGGELGGVRILNGETIELMIRDQLPADVSLPDQFGANYGLAGYGFGLGFRVRKNVEESGLQGNVGEFGWAGAYETYFLVDPSKELVGLFMTQVQPSGHYPLRREFTNLVYSSLARRP